MSERNVVAPTCAELSDAGWAGSEYSSVQREADDSWRHGSYITETFKRASDETYWRASYCLCLAIGANELREGIATIVRVYPHTVTVTTYRPEPTT